MIKLYTNHCPLCNNLKELLDKKQISYEEVTDEQLMLSLGITRTPMLQVSPEERLNYKQALQWINTQER